MISKMSSLEEKVKLPPTDTISRCYQPGHNNRIIRILTVAVYVLCVSLAAILLSLYYIFIWDPATIRPFITKPNNCEKIVIPEKIAIRLLNSSEITAEQFYKQILEQYRILQHLQRQRQQYLQQQHLHLQQLAAANKFQDIFATATIIQANANSPIKKPITPTNGTFLLQPQSIVETSGHVPVLDTQPVFVRRKSHRKHNQHHRHSGRKQHRKVLAPANDQISGEILHRETPLNQLTSIIETPYAYTPLPIPLILNSNEDKTTSTRQKPPTVTSSHDNPFLGGEFIFEK